MSHSSLIGLETRWDDDHREAELRRYPNGGLLPNDNEQQKAVCECILWAYTPKYVQPFTEAEFRSRKTVVQTMKTKEAPGRDRIQIEIFFLYMS